VSPLVKDRSGVLQTLRGWATRAPDEKTFCVQRTRNQATVTAQPRINGLRWPQTRAILDVIRLNFLSVMAILLIGGGKTGDNRWYEVHVPIADKLYDQHLEQLKLEGDYDG
jgi:hypothetical protein